MRKTQLILRYCLIVICLTGPAIKSNAGDIVHYENTIIDLKGNEKPFIAFEAESFSLVTDTGYTWVGGGIHEESIKNDEWLVTGMDDAGNGVGITHPYGAEAGPDWYEMGEFTGPHKSVVSYRVQFETPGDYFLHYYSSSNKTGRPYSDTFWIAESPYGSGLGAFDASPNSRLVTGNTGNFLWRLAFPMVYTVTDDMVNKPLTFNVGARENLTRLDAFILTQVDSQDAGIREAQRNYSNEIQLIEAENFDRASSSTVQWNAVADPENGPHENHTGTSWLTLDGPLSDNTDPMNTNSEQAPWVEYDVHVDRAGVYNLMFRSGGTSEMGNSIYAMIQGARRIGDEVGEIETTVDGFWDWNTAGDWEFDAAGDYVIRLMHQEAGIAVDSMRFTARYSSQQVRGDFNGDNVVGEADIQAMFATIYEASENRWFDLNFDEVVDELDLIELVTGVLDTAMGDVNLDQKVDLADLARLATNFGTESDALWGQGDMNGDGMVDLADLAKIATNFGFGTGQGAIGGASAESLLAIMIPEPATALYGALGMMIIGIRRRR